ncbi:MAG: hypothetical protein C4K60_02570 [Ideonella sp. MAG2]|nr:MAG: hypothetical protein C4K60_02570 [Ideonella sp. MAG2]
MAALVACAPALNWREVRSDRADWIASFPCKPDLHVRQVSLEGLAGQKLTMALRVCEVDGQTFAMSEVDVQEPARVPVVLKNLQVAFAGNVGALAAVPPGQAWSVKGMTPQPDAGRWHLEGTMPSGQAVKAEMGLASRGTVVVQLTVSGRTAPPEAALQFFEGLVFQGQ